jgi:hypothetical protein
MTSRCAWQRCDPPSWQQQQLLLLLGAAGAKQRARTVAV